jgi:hypothetical protein
MWRASAYYDTIKSSCVGNQQQSFPIDNAVMESCRATQKNTRRVMLLG